ncbi:BppU family phage baseplate upper protein [Listeria innocua]|uniref:BppU family phage baseplate upper protein n=1 Tax=Listeria innocua TaxID=1642 RepID=UPI0016288295|nr:BppU family phage baseplate upper protein [Listeria innocua]
MTTNEVIVLSMSDTNYIGSLLIRRNDLDTPEKQFKCVKKDGTPFDFTDYTPVFETRTPSGEVIRDYNYDEHLPFTNIDEENGVFEYTFSNSLFAETGNYRLSYFVFEKWDNVRESILNRKSTQNFSFNIIEDVYSGKPTPESAISDWLRLLEQYQSWRNDLETILLTDKQDLLNELYELINLADEIQDRFDAIDPAQFAKKAGDTFTGTIEFDGIPTIFQSRLNDSLWYQLTSENNITYQQSLFPTVISGIDGETGAGYNFKQSYMKLNDVDVETVEGSQAKIDNAHTETNIWSGESYFLDTHIFSWDSDKIKHGVLLEFSRYAPGTGALDYGYIQYFFSKDYLTRYSNKATWINMPGATDGAKKTVRFTSSSVRGDASNGDSPNTSYALRNVSIL